MTDQIALTDEEKAEFIAYFGLKTRSFPTNSAARSIVTQQNHAWAQILNMFPNIIDSESRTVDEQHYSAIFFARIIAIIQHIQCNVFEDDGVTKIISELPIIEPNDGISYQVVARDPWFCLAVVFDAIADAVWSRLSRDSPPPPEQLGIMTDPRLTQAQAVLHGFGDSKKHDEAISAGVTEAQAAVGKMLENVESAAGENKIQVDTFIDAAKSEIDAAKRSFGERLILEAGYIMWQKKAEGHSKRFGIGLLIFAICIGGSFYWVFYYGNDFLGKLPKKQDEHTYISILIVALCAVGVGWLLRFIAKYTSDNLALGADAAQRKVMVQTYLALVADKDAKMEPADRSMMLHAAFRPLPGQQSDDIPAPTVVEMIQKALATKP